LKGFLGKKKKIEACLGKTGESTEAIKKKEGRRVRRTRRATKVKNLCGRGTKKDPRKQKGKCVNKKKRRKKKPG